MTTTIKAPFVTMQNPIERLTNERKSLEKALPEALKWKEWALAELEKQKSRPTNYDCMCGKNRTEYCSNFACSYSRLRENEYIDGPISHANWIEKRMAEIKTELWKLKSSV